MENSMIDKVAMAIASKVDEGTFYKAPAFQAAARAAIAAMREPTEEMETAAGKVWEVSYFGDSKVRENIRTEYIAMIDAALEDSK